MTDDEKRASDTLKRQANQPRGTKKYFNPRVERMKKHLDKAAEKAVKSLERVIDKQAEQGKADAAIWVLEHHERDGERVISPSIDKKVEAEGGNKILINVPVFTERPALPEPQPVGAKVIDVTPERKLEE